MIGTLGDFHEALWQNIRALTYSPTASLRKAETVPDARFSSGAGDRAPLPVRVDSRPNVLHVCGCYTLSRRGNTEIGNSGRWVAANLLKIRYPKRKTARIGGTVRATNTLGLDCTPSAKEL